MGVLRQKLLFLEPYAYDASSWVGNFTTTSLIGSGSTFSVSHEETLQILVC
jgi:hypothetical protein